MTSNPLPLPAAGCQMSEKSDRWGMVVFLALASAVNYADRTAMSTVLPALRSELGLSDVALGLLGSFFLWSYAVFSPIAGVLADRLSRSAVVTFSLVAWSVVTALTGLVPGFNSLLVLRVALGVSECLFLPAAYALIAQFHALSTRARAMSLISIGVNGGVVIGGAAAGFLAEHWGWRASFLVFGAMGLVLAMLAKRLLPGAATNGRVGPMPARPTFHRPRLWPALRQLLRVRTYHLLLLEAVLSGIGIWVFLSWLPLFFRDSFNMSLGEAGFAGTFMLQTCSLLGIVIGGWISDRLASRRTERRLLVFAFCYFAAAPPLLLFLAHPGFATIAIAISLFALFRGIGQANDKPILCEIVPEHLRATAIGLMNACATGIGGCGVFLAGVLKGALGLQAIFASVAVLFAIAGIALLLAYHFTGAEDIRRARENESANVASASS